MPTSALTSDPTVFPDPDTYNRSAFWTLQRRNPKLPFGFGRRVCPGMHIALQAMFITLSRMLWAFDILQVLENGKEVLQSADDFTTKLVTRPANLRSRLVPRHKGVADFIALEAERAETEAAAYEW